MIYFTFSPTSNHTGIYRVTQEGLLIARANQLKARQKHLLHVSPSNQKLNHYMRCCPLKNTCTVVVDD